MLQLGAIKDRWRSCTGKRKASLKTGKKLEREQEKWKGIKKAKVQFKNINYFKSKKRGSKLLLFA
jgi:hypothetical protein